MGASGAKYGSPPAISIGLARSRDGVRRRVHDAFLLRIAARSVPEYLRLRFDEKTRGLNAVSFAIMTCSLPAFPCTRWRS